MSAQAIIHKHAHDSGDGATIYHCFAGETRYWTVDGIKTLAETVGTEQRVLAATAGGGAWVDARIHEFGEQPLLKVTLKRNKRIKVVYSTPEHRWLVRTTVGQGKSKKREVRIRLAKDLKPDNRIAWSLPRTRIAKSVPSPFGIAHGIVYGDGTRAAKGSVINLWGEKDQQLLRYFPESRIDPRKTPNGVEGVHVKDLPAFFKRRPDLEESVPYIYGWLAGYFAADGSVNPQGQAHIHSASREDLEFFQLAAMRLGIGSYDIVEKTRNGFGNEPSKVYSLQLIGSTLRPEFFLIAEHRARYETVVERANAERIGWTVVSVEQTDRFETVYCAVVPKHENFVLDGLINTMNCPFCGGGQVIGRSDGGVECQFCKQAFTVQVQPMYPGFPQTVNGMPFPIPGMPGQIGGPPAAPGADAVMPPDGAVPGEDGADDGNPFADGDPADGGEADDGGAPPFGDDDAGDGGEDSGGAPPPPPGKGKKKSSARAEVYRTAAGDLLSAEAFARHMAIRHATGAERAALLERLRCSS